MVTRKPGLLEKANKVLPLLAVMVGAVATWTSVQMRVDYIENKLQDHLGGWGHDSWFGPDGVLHPGLRGCIERYIDTTLQHRMEEMRVRIFSERDDLWKRFYRANVGKVNEP
jgi:hypothetical protein